LTPGDEGGGSSISAATAESVLAFFARSENRELVAALSDAGVRPVSTRKRAI